MAAGSLLAAPSGSISESEKDSTKAGNELGISVLDSNASTVCATSLTSIRLVKGMFLRPTTVAQVVEVEGLLDVEPTLLLGTDT